MSSHKRKRCRVEACRHHKLLAMPITAEWLAQMAKKCSDDEAEPPFFSPAGRPPDTRMKHTPIASAGQVHHCPLHGDVWCTCPTPASFDEQCRKAIIAGRRLAKQIFPDRFAPNDHPRDKSSKCATGS